MAADADAVSDAVVGTVTEAWKGEKNTHPLVPSSRQAPDESAQAGIQKQTKGESREKL